jgi:cystathionine gamma-synthase
VSAHQRKGDATVAARAGGAVDTAHGAVMPPVYLSANYAFEGLGRKRAYDYSRTANPTRDVLAGTLAELEEGAGAVVTASGMAAITLVAHLLEPRDLCVAPHDGYGGTFRLLTALAKKGHFRVRFVDLRDEAELGEALCESPRLVWIEDPSNPLLRRTDIRAVAEKAHAAGALVAVDNTFLSPALQKPIRLGADLVVHSTTKYLNGHSDVVGGAVVAREQALVETLAWWANCLGLTGSPFDSYLTLRGLRTLGPRMRVHQENAAAVAALLADHPAVRAVHWPKLGAMVSFELAPRRGAVDAFLSGLSCFTLAESLGGVESLVAHPATMTHASMTPETRERAGITDTLLRLSVGIEASDDLLDDLRGGLARVERLGRASRCAGLR